MIFWHTDEECSNRVLIFAETRWFAFCDLISMPSKFRRETGRFVAWCAAEGAENVRVTCGASIRRSDLCCAMVRVRVGTMGRGLATRSAAIVARSIGP